jgi:hypothetical protein
VVLYIASVGRLLFCNRPLPLFSLNRSFSVAPERVECRALERRTSAARYILCMLSTSAAMSAASGAPARQHGTLSGTFAGDTIPLQ